MSSDISFIVCSNGYGHLKRVLLVIAALIKQKPDIKITLFCPGSHLKIAKEEINFADNGLIQYRTSASLHEISWLKPESITRTRYQAWCNDMAADTDLQNSRLVVSDNHVAPLHVFKDAVLMGSFLWHDVAAFHNEDVDALIKEDSALLQKLNPAMLCLESMAMDAVNEQTRAIKLPWFSAKYSGRFSHPKEKAVLVTGGGTALINKTLAEITVLLAKKDELLQVYVDSKIFELVQKERLSNISRFSFTDEAFSKLLAIVCRPGVGILTDCVRYSLPPFTVNDGYNKEIDHNAARVEDLGIGKSLRSDEHDAEDIASRIFDFINNEDQLAACLSALKNEEANGADKAARFLLNNLN